MLEVSRSQTMFTFLRGKIVPRDMEVLWCQWTTGVLPFIILQW